MSETQTVTIADFLLARIAEDEEMATSAAPYYPSELEIVAEVWEDCAAHLATHSPARVLAECEAKRRILAAYEDERQRMDIYNRDHKRGLLTTEGDLRARHSANAVWAGLDTAVLLLALPYADHELFQEEWRA